MCKEHYGELTGTCDKLLPDLTRARKCPKPAPVQPFLVQNTDFTGKITAADSLCYACYKSCLWQSALLLPDIERDVLYSKTVNWIRCRLSFALSIMSLGSWVMS